MRTIFKNDNLSIKTVSQWVDRSISATLPLAFFGSGFLNMIAFVLGLHAWDTVQTIVTFGILGAAALLFFSRVMWLFVQTPTLRRAFCFMSLIPIAFGAVYLWALAVQADKGFILKNAVVNGCYLLSSWSALILIIVEKRLRSFLRTCRIYAWILAPIVLYYCIRFYLPSADYTTRDLGTLSYMPLAYTLLTLNVLFLLEILLYDTTQKTVPFFFRINLALFLLFSTAIVLSGTKGAIACLLFTSLVFICIIKNAPFAGIYFQFPLAWSLYFFPSCSSPAPVWITGWSAFYTS